jgi:hypothetical protein
MYELITLKDRACIYEHKKISFTIFGHLDYLILITKVQLKNKNYKTIPISLKKKNTNSTRRPTNARTRPTRAGPRREARERAGTFT